jgi:hypothetical protein
MEPHAMTVDELIAASADLHDRAHGLFDRLAAVNASARDECGIEVTVNLDGMIIALDLTAAALRLGPDRLAAELTRLTHQAAGTALARGLDILEPVAGDALLGLLVPDEAPSPLAAGDDFAAIESWAV